MKKIKTLLIAAIAMVSMIFAVSPVASATAAADENVTAYTLDFSDENLEEKLYAAYIPSMSGGSEELSSHWTVENDVLKRVGDCDGSDVTGNYAVTYLNGCYLRYFELTTKVACGEEKGLTGVAFGKNDISLRHFADGNAMYFMPGTCVELAGSTITQKATSSYFTAKTEYYELKLIVCADYIKVLVDGVERIHKTLPSELLRYGRIGLFTANTAGSFADGVEIYNLDEHGNRIAFEEYTATTGIAVTNKTVEMMLSDEKVKLEYAFQPANATVQGVRFLSVNPDIAVVDNEGYIHPLKAGVTEIQVITADGGFKDSLIVTVTETIPTLEGVTLDKTSGHIDTVGGKLYLTASYFPEEAENLGFKWSSSNAKVAIVSNGTVTAMGEGTCTITVKDYYGNFSATCVVTVGGETQEEEESSGCGSTVGMGAAALLVGAVSVVTLVKRKEK